MDQGLFQFSRKPTMAESYLYPFVALMVIIAADQLTDSVLLTPMLSICVLALMTFHLETEVLVFWLVIFACNVFYSLFDNPGGIAPEVGWTVVVRFFSFLVTASLVLVANRDHLKLSRNHRHLLEMLNLLPCAVVVSDENGAVLFSNKKTTELLNKKTDEVVGHSFFAFFSYAEERGADIENYLRLTEEKKYRETVLAVTTAANTKRSMPAAQIPITLVGQECLVTAIETDGKMADFQTSIDWLQQAKA